MILIHLFIFLILRVIRVQSWSWLKFYDFHAALLNPLKKYSFLLMETMYTYLAIVLYSLILMEIKWKCRVFLFCTIWHAVPVLSSAGSFSKFETTLHSCIAVDRCKGHTIVGSKIFQAKFILFITSMMMIKTGHHTREK